MPFCLISNKTNHNRHQTICETDSKSHDGASDSRDIEHIVRLAGLAVTEYAFSVFTHLLVGLG
jgi:hypothetical protein